MTRLYASQNSSRWLLHPLRAAVIACSLNVVLPQLLWAQPAAESASIQFDIPAGPLDAALNRFGRQTGVLLSVDAELTKNKTSPGVRGEQTVQTALQQLLKGTGLAAVRADDGSYSLRQLPPGDEVTLKAVNVRSNLESAYGPVNGYVAKRSATATKSDVPLREVAQSISVITRDQMTDQGVTAVQESLRYSAGVSTDIYGARNTTEYFLIRGSKPTTLLNGLRLGQQWFAEPLDEAYAFERIEVLRGPSAVIAGQTGPGGVINLVSKRPQEEASREVSVQLGNYDRKQIAADLTGPLNEDGSLLYRLVGVALDTESQVDYADYERTFIAPSLTWRSQVGTTLTLYAEYQHDENGNNDAFLPVVGTLEPGPHGRISDHRFIGEPGWDGNVGSRWRAGYEIEQALGSAWTLRHHLRHDDSDRELKSMYTEWWTGFVDAAGTPDANGRYLNRAWAIDEGRTLSTAADLLLEGRFDTGPLQHTFVTGVDVLRYRRNDSYLEGLETPLDMYSPTYGSFTPPDALDESAAYKTRPRVQQVGLLAIDHVRIGRWAVTLGLRHDDARTETPDDTQRVDDWSRNFGVVYLADGGWSPYASYSESFEAQGASVTGRMFSPKRGEQYEAGVKWQPDASKLRATAALFRLQEKNRLKSDPTNPLNQIESDPVTVQGVELEAGANLGAWDFVVAYTRLSAKDEAAGTRVAFIAEDTASAWVQHRFGAYGLPQLTAGLGVRYVGATSNGSDTVTVPSVTLGDAVVAWQQDTWRVALNVTNLSDEEFVASCDPSEYCWYGARRRIVTSATYRW